MWTWFKTTFTINTVFQWRTWYSINIWRSILQIREHWHHADVLHVPTLRHSPFISPVDSVLGQLSYSLTLQFVAVLCWIGLLCINTVQFWQRMIMVLIIIFFLIHFKIEPISYYISWWKVLLLVKKRTRNVMQILYLLREACVHWLLLSATRNYTAHHVD